MKNLFKQGTKTTIIAGSGTALFALSKGIVGFLSGSVVLMGDAVHSAADAVSTLLAWFGLRIAQKDPTEKFPYGFYKVENVTALLISALIFFAGFNIARESISKLFTTYELGIPIIAISVAVLDGIVMFFIGTYEMKSGQSINSQSLIADGKESRLHLLSSSVVVFGLVASFLQFPYLEGIAGFVISLFIFEAAYDTGKDAIFALMDVAPEGVEDLIEETLQEVSGIQDFENLKLRKSGPFVFGEVDAKVRKSLNVNRAHEISEDIEGKIKEKTSRIDSFSVKFIPYQTEKKKVGLPIKKDEGLGSELSEQLGRADSFLLVEVSQGEIENFEVIKNPHQDKEKRAGLAASKMLVEEKIDSLIVKQIGPISLHTLRDNIVDVYRVDQERVEDILQSFNEEELEIIKQPTREKS